MAAPSLKYKTLTVRVTMKGTQHSQKILDPGGPKGRSPIDQILMANGIVLENPCKIDNEQVLVKCLLSSVIYRHLVPATLLTSSIESIKCVTSFITADS